MNQVPVLYANMTHESHILIGGCTGSGKSVLLNGFIHTLRACYTPAQVQWVLLDPKLVELSEYRHDPHTLCYADTGKSMIAALQNTVRLMMDRYAEMQRRGLKTSPRNHIYVIIDEFADLMTMYKKDTVEYVQRLAQLGRAANIHLVIATQRPTREIIPGKITVNLDARIALRVTTAQDSRNIIMQAGAERLSLYGYCLYLSPRIGSGVQQFEVPKIE